LLYICTYPIFCRNDIQKREIHGSELEDPRSVTFNVDAVYAVCGGTPH
jgi:hypothetical protein